MKRKLKTGNLVILIVCAVCLCFGIWFLFSRNNPAAGTVPQSDSASEPGAGNTEKPETEEITEESQQSDVDFEEEEVIELGENEEQGGF